MPPCIREPVSPTRLRLCHPLVRPQLRQPHQKGRRGEIRVPLLVRWGLSRHRLDVPAPTGLAATCSPAGVHRGVHTAARGPSHLKPPACCQANTSRVHTGTRNSHLRHAAHTLRHTSGMARLRGQRLHGCSASPPTSCPRNQPPAILFATRRRSVAHRRSWVPHARASGVGSSQS